MTSPRELHDRVQSEVGRVLIGNEDVIDHLTISLLAQGHILLEGVPGVAKTTIAKLFAEATGLNSNRIQMTPDLLPADITGSYVYRQKKEEFEVVKGPIFTNLLVADEINRATPKTQSSLLEGMQEGYTTIEGTTYSLPSPFMVIATQNPIEMEGTFPLPEAQRDRFQFKLNVDLPDREEELELLDRFGDNPDVDDDGVTQVVKDGEIYSSRQVVNDVHVDDEVKSYIQKLVGETRSHSGIEHGASPRASITCLNASKARAAIEGRSYVIPDDVKYLAKSVLRHRIILNTQSELSEVTEDEVIDGILDSMEPVEVERGKETNVEV